MNKLVAFDLDGTLSRSDLFLMPAYREALSLVGWGPLPDEKLKTLIGGTADDNARIISPDGTIETYREFDRHVVRIIRETAAGLVRAYPQVPESLAELRRRGYQIFLCSNAKRDYTGLILGSLGLLPYFDGTPEGEPGWDKPRLLRRILDDARPDAAVMVGDRHYDREAARANGIPFIGCLYGLFPAEAAEADAPIAAAGVLPAAVERLIGR